jgi:hypothetical protein
MTPALLQARPDGEADPAAAQFDAEKHFLPDPRLHPNALLRADCALPPDPPAYGGRLVDAAPDVFRAYFNRKPFHVRHRLLGHPLFALPRLVELARKLPEKFVEYNAGALPVGVRPEDTPRTGLSADETVRRIAECGSWMVLKRVEQDPDYGALLALVLDDIARHAPDLVPPMKQREGFIFLSSPGAVTPFHIDPEYNFLLQIQGRKTVSMWDPDDRFVLPERELETFYASFVHRNLPWRDVFQTTAYVLPLGPGQGLHFPVTVPHWVKNGPEVSISFSVTFRSSASERRELLYKANARLRRLGFSPAPVGQSALRDGAKLAAFGSLAAVKRAMRPSALLEGTREAGAGSLGIVKRALEPFSDSVLFDRTRRAAFASIAAVKRSLQPRRGAGPSRRS